MAEYENEKGMNLLEIMVTMFMVALLGSSLLGGFVVSQKTIKQAGQVTRASSFAYQVLEDLRARPAEDWADIAGKTENGSYMFAVNGKKNYDMDLQATVRLNENRDIPSLYDAQVVVTWKEGEMCRNLEMVTLLNPALRGAKI